MIIDEKSTKGHLPMSKITKDMGIIDIIQSYPETIEIFQKYGFGCIGCAAARFENLEAGAKVHGIDPDKMVEDLNAIIA
jgi:hybrid cluster-associated redox disulfide protein